MIDIATRIDKLLHVLETKSSAKRAEAIDALASLGAGKILAPVGDALLFGSDEEYRRAYLEVLERCGAARDLGDVRTDGWFERIGEQFDSFDSLCDLIGTRFLAYSMMLGVQIRAVTTDPRSAANTTIEFTLGDDMPQSLTLGEFRIRLVRAVEEQRVDRQPCELPLTREKSMRLIGRPLLLLAPLFDITLQKIAVVDPGAPRLLVVLSLGNETIVRELAELEEQIRNKVRRDLAGAYEEPFRLDLAAVSLAREMAASGDTDGVVATLGNWPGMLVSLQRSPVMKQLDDQQLALISEGVQLLGDAFLARERPTWSEELYRLGLQFAREGPPAGLLYQRLGLLLSREKRYGEAIGLLRRALYLGIPQEEILPALGRAFLERGKLVIAAALLENARSLNVVDPELDESLAEVHRRFDEAGVAWNVPSTAGTK
ncbi:MAG: hypothetical protein R6V85_20870 [Polyangia bacterium]